MYICFVEYRIAQDATEAYLEWIAPRAERYEALTLHEGVGQQDLYVEVWTMQTEEEAHRIREERRSAHSSWSEMNQWVAGVPARVQAWVFRPVSFGRSSV
ncbi:hypothetical protein IDH44_10785 [Paenibacillus sp. IB182496]|uniref:Uncharacterized protein n=1 Tax=Paenibacillus sabuli TaxID=2772509 RepID=A0A927BTW2_9BACL|nr:hypothetical protein [Paenibacillus sabuli]MBD2845675.1 hypothetical protein [Paenibacillus sabuli]